MGNQPEWVGEPFRLGKYENDQLLVVVCEMWRCSHDWQLRLVIDGIGLDTVANVRDEEMIEPRVAQLRQTMVSRGWQEIADLQRRPQAQRALASPRRSR
jgi:hypothetical protein